MPSYRGYTIDSLGNLTSLDDVIITADERHDFKGMNKRSELLKNEARITVKIPFVRGIPNPAELDEVQGLFAIEEITSEVYVVLGSILFLFV